MSSTGWRRKMIAVAVEASNVRTWTHADDIDTTNK